MLDFNFQSWQEILQLIASWEIGMIFWYVIFKLNQLIGGWGIICEIALRWVLLDLTVMKSTLVQVMAWCHQATSRCLSQCWPRSMSPYVVTRTQWVVNLHRQYHDYRSSAVIALAYCSQSILNAVPKLHCWFFLLSLYRKCVFAYR